MTRRWLGPAIVVLLALAATMTSIGHDFTFDDRYVILGNARVHELVNVWKLFGQTYWPPELGSDGYRPLVMSLFTVQWVAGGGAPWVFHLVNILLAVATALAVWWCAAAVLPAPAAWIAAALFAVHPVHVEVTGNVVGQSELLVALFLTLAVGIYLRARRRGALAPREIAAILTLYALGLLSKEHAVVLPAILAAAEWTVLDDRPWRERIRPLRLHALLFALVAVLYLFVRAQVTRDLAGFVPFPVFTYLHMGALDRAAMMMTEIPRIGRLLVFPTHLSGDYSPQDVVIASGFDPIQLPGIFICIGVALLAFALRRRSPVASFGLFWLIVAFLPVSNLIVPAGFITAERTLFFPSVGLVLVAGAVVAALLARARRAEVVAMAAAVTVLLALGLGRSIDRQRVWKNNTVFFDQLVLDAPNGYRAHLLRARQAAAEHRLRDTDVEYRRAIRLFPYDAAMIVNLASDYHKAGLCRATIAMLDWSYQVDPRIGRGRLEYVNCLAKVGRWADSRAAALVALAVAPTVHVSLIRQAVARADSALGRPRGGHRAVASAALSLSQTARMPQNPAATARDRGGSVRSK